MAKKKRGTKIIQPVISIYWHIWKQTSTMHPIASFWQPNRHFDFGFTTFFLHMLSLYIDKIRLTSDILTFYFIVITSKVIRGIPTVGHSRIRKLWSHLLLHCLIKMSALQIIFKTGRRRRKTSFLWHCSTTINTKNQCWKMPFLLVNECRQLSVAISIREDFT